MGQAVTILCLGDSITAGANGEHPDSPYSRHLPDIIDKAVEMTNEGYSGFGVRDLKDKLEESLDRRPQDVVVLMGGTNDLLMTPAKEIVPVLRDAWLMALEKGSRVVALTILEARLSDDFHENQIELNKLIKAAVKDIKDDKLTCYDACFALPSQEARPDLFNDPIHLTRKGYKVLGQGIGLYLNTLLNSLDTPLSRRHSLFRPCIDLHSGVVKQIVGGTLSDESLTEVSKTRSQHPDTSTTNLKTNYVSEKPASHYAELYKTHNLQGGHVIMLGPGCTEAAEAALGEWPNSLQVGGGINDKNALKWLELGASKVILTSWLFPNGAFSMDRLEQISSLVGRDKLVLDLSCRLNQGRSGWTVAMNKWQTLTQLEITLETLDMLKHHCSEFLIHAADVEGLQAGVDLHLVEFLGLWASKQNPPFQITYAGGARSIADLELVDRVSRGSVDLTIGSALDIFGGSGATLHECVQWNAHGSTPAT